MNDNSKDEKNIFLEFKKKALENQMKELNLDELINIEDIEFTKNKEFFEDNDFINDITKFISNFNRKSIINSKLYQRNKGYQKFINFIIDLKKMKYYFTKPNTENNQLKFSDFCNSYLNDNKIIDIYENINNFSKKNDNNISNGTKEDNLSNDYNENNSLNKINDNNQSSSQGRNINNNSDYKKKGRGKDLEKKNFSKSQIATIPKSKSSEKSKKKDLSKSIIKLNNNLNVFEIDENTDGKSYELNAIDFIKYVLFFSFIEKSVNYPDHILKRNIPESLFKTLNIEKVKIYIYLLII